MGISWIVMIVLGLMPLARATEGDIAVMLCTNWQFDEADHQVFMVDQYGQFLVPISQAPNWGFVIKQNGKWMEITRMPIDALGGPREVRYTELSDYCLAAIDRHFTRTEEKTIIFGPNQKTWRW